MYVQACEFLYVQGGRKRLFIHIREFLAEPNTLCMFIFSVAVYVIFLKVNFPTIFSVFVIEHFSASTVGPAKTYILIGTPRTYASKTWAVTDNWTIKKGPRKKNRGPVRGTDSPRRGTEGPVTGTGPPLIAQNPF